MHDALISLIPVYGPWIVFGVIALESAGIPLPGETILIAAALLAATTHEIDIVFVVIAAAAGAVVGDGIGYSLGRQLGPRLLRKYGRYVHLDEDRLLIGRYLFFKYGSAVVFFGRFIAVLRMFAALLAGVNAMPAGRFILFNVTGGICWACLFGFGTYAVGSEIYEISGLLSVVTLGLFIAAGVTLSIGLRRYETALCRRAKKVLASPRRQRRMKPIAPKPDALRRLEFAEQDEDQHDHENEAKTAASVVTGSVKRTAAKSAEFRRVVR